MDIEGDENKSIINVEAIDNGSESIISIFEISSDSVAETQSQPLLEISDDNTSTSHPADHTDKLDFTIDVSGSSNKKLLEEHDDGSDKIEYLTPHIMSSSTPSLSLSSSSSTSSSSSDLPIDLSQVDTNEEEAAGIEISIIEDDDDDDDEVSISSEGGGSSKSERQGMSPLILELMTPQANSSSDDVMIHESNVHGMSSPKIQTMERFGGGYDPKRIPSSVFEISKTTTPMEWSAASNESLFSIHVGNSSFSRDNLFAYNDSVAKSGELTKSGSAVVQNDGGGGMKEKTTKDTIKPPPPTTTADDTPSTTNKAPTAPLSSNSSSHSHQSDGSAASFAREHEKRIGKAR
ncbi:suppressor protein SRP40 isoform X8 [Cannabis sativa]|uniref:suppressor protein SRP40 isoform X8 n=1 Tax=Cannabis sativa TaxID=3483 RepID=UPI0029CA817B|nr:suppressor protein SRP40 isoform X8 [Cannabis sativa]